MIVRNFSQHPLLPGHLRVTVRTPEQNARLLAAFRARERAIRRALGADVRIETWDKGWARVWEPVPLAALDRSFLERIGARIAAYITTLEPLLRSEVPSDISWTESRPRR